MNEMTINDCDFPSDRVEVGVHNFESRPTLSLQVNEGKSACEVLLDPPSALDLRDYIDQQLLGRAVFILLYLDDTTLTFRPASKVRFATRKGAEEYAATELAELNAFAVAVPGRQP